MHLQTSTTPGTASSSPAHAGTPLLSVVIPCYNERFTIREVLRRVAAAPYDKEIIVVDDGSTDGTGVLLEELASLYPGVHVVRQPRNRGKGAAVRAGVAVSRGEFVIVQDADLEYNPSDYPVLLAPALAGQADVVYGSRLMAGPRRVHLFWHMLANRVLTFLSGLTTNLNLTDMETGYKLFRGDIIRNIPLRSHGFGFEPEVTAKVAKLGCRVFEVPISYSGRDRSEGKKVGFFDVASVWTILKYWVISDIGTPGHHTLARMAELGAYNKELFLAIERGLGARVLDLGAGVGNLAGFVLDRTKVVLADFDDVYLTILERRFGAFENVEIVKLDLETFTGARDVAPLGIDSVMCLNVLEHIEQDERVLRELAAGLPAGGRMALVVPSMRALYSGLDRELGHFRRYERQELIDKLTRAGLTVESCRFFNWIGAIGWFVYGRVLRRSHITKVATRGFRVVSWLRALEGDRGFRLGLSLIAVAVKKG